MLHRQASIVTLRPGYSARRDPLTLWGGGVVAGSAFAPIRRGQKSNSVNQNATPSATWATEMVVKVHDLAQAMHSFAHRTTRAGGLKILSGV